MNNYKFLPQVKHGIINVGDLPIPFDIVLNAAVLVIILTFVFLKTSWKESILTSQESLFSTKQSFAGKSFGFLILLLLTVPGLINNEAATTSITPPSFMDIFMDCCTCTWSHLWRFICKI